MDAGLPDTPCETGQHDAHGTPPTTRRAQQAPAHSVEIRRLLLADVEEFWRLRLRALRDHPGAFASDYEGSRARPPEEVRQQFAARNLGPESLVLGACGPAAVTAPQPLLGSIGCFREQGNKERHKAIIWAMYVAPEARGRGVGQMLVEAAIATASNWSGVEQLHLAVAADNDSARRLYRRLGFAVWGTEPRALRLPDRYVDEEHMVLRLTSSRADEVGN